MVGVKLSSANDTIHFGLTRDTDCKRVPKLPPTSYKPCTGLASTVPLCRPLKIPPRQRRPQVLP